MKHRTLLPQGQVAEACRPTKTIETLMNSAESLVAAYNILFDAPLTMHNYRGSIQLHKFSTCIERFFQLLDIRLKQLFKFRVANVPG